MWKRNAVVAVVILFICVAVYLNWSYSRDSTDDTINTDPEYVQAEDDMTADLTDNTSNLSDEASVGDDVAVADAAYFAEARLNRQSSRDSAIAMLNSSLDGEEVTQAMRDNTNEQITAIATAAMSEARIENLVMAKGFSDCVAFIGADSISIVVAAPAGGFTQADTAKIKDIAVSETGMRADCVKIVPVG